MVLEEWWASRPVKEIYQQTACRRGLAAPASHFVTKPDPALHYQAKPDHNHLEGGREG